VRSGREFCAALLDAVRDDPVARVCLLARFAEWGGQSVYLPVMSDADARVSVARKLLASRMTPGEAAEALRKRFGCSLRTAQRSVKAAKNLS